MTTPPSNVVFDWQKCIFCQKQSRREKTTCPADSKRKDVGVGYQTVATAIEGFRKIDKLPTNLLPYVAFWDGEGGVHETLIRHRALWHISCKQRLIHGTTLDRLQAASSYEYDPVLGEDEIDESANVSCQKVPRITRSQSSTSLPIHSTSRFADASCFFCNSAGTDLRQVMTFEVDEKVRKCASVLSDSVLLSKLAVGDMIALEAKYHPSCLLGLYYKANQFERNLHPLSVDADDDDVSVTGMADSGFDIESLALAEVISFMEDTAISETAPAVFKLSELVKIYMSFLSRYNCKQTAIHSTRFKERLLEAVPNLTAIPHGRDVLLTLSDNLGIALQELRNQASSDVDAVHIMHTAKIIRRDIFSQKHEFDGNLQIDSTAVPSTLLYLVTMILEGIGCATTVDSVAALTLSQLMIFNCQKRRRNVHSENLHINVPVIRHVASREPPLPIYVGLMLHSATRKKKHIEKLHKLGLSISYDRVMQLCNKTTNTICSQYRHDNIVCPPSLKHGYFTVAAVDNIDHNLSSTTAQASFHGTALSLMQFDNRDRLDMTTSYCAAASDKASDIALPVSYTEINPCILPSKDPPVLKAEVEPELSDVSESNITDDEYKWLQVVAENIMSDKELEENNLAWAAFHAVRNEPSGCPCSSVLLPLFRQSANTAAMMRHTLVVVQDVLRKLNEDQTPVIAADQPLFALLKQIQWHWPNKFGEQHIVILLGGLHTEMAVLRMIGHWLNGSGWSQCLVQSGIATIGVAESLLSASHVKRARYAHTVSAAALYISLQQCYLSYCGSLTDETSLLAFSEWREDCCLRSAQFQYWSTVLELELLLLSFVRSLRLGNFVLYVECLQKLAPWFFVCDQTHYARWLSVHLRDMLCIRTAHPDVYEQFVKGNFTVVKSNHKFSRIAVDQAHEQLNASLKGDGGAVGLTENDAALCRWTVTGPEIVRLLEQFESVYLEDVHDTNHHEQTHSFQCKFKQDVSRMLGVLAVEVPFSTTSGNDVIALCSNVVADRSVAQTVKTAKVIGIDQFQKFFSERLSASANVSVMSPLPRNKLPLFLFKPQKSTMTRSSLQLTSVKSDCHLFSRLYIACQTRDGNLDEFFRYENQAYPPSLSRGGSLYTGTKSDLLDSLPVTQIDNEHEMTFTASILDGAVTVQMLKPNNAQTFSDYRAKVFIPYLMSVLSKVERIDVVFDIYREHSLKLLTREKRGVGTRTHVVGHTKIPMNWQEFLRVDGNKTELFHFLAESDLGPLVTGGKAVIFTYDDSVRVAVGSLDVSAIQCCNHEEADTRIILHCYHAGLSGCKNVCIRTVDTDVVILAISFFAHLSLSELWIHFGVGRNARYLAVHEISASLGPSKCSVLPVFHALTGCDTTSAFYGKGKKTAWLTWEAYPDLSQALHTLATVTEEVDAETLSVLERFVILLYDRTSYCLTLDQARKHMFTKKSKTLETIPPTSNAFLQHVRRTVYQAVHCWSHCLEPLMPTFDPVQWGWCKDGEKWLPQWTTIPQVSSVCQELLCCSCKKSCTARCKCVKANLPCTGLCQCDGECDR